MGITDKKRLVRALREMSQLLEIGGAGRFEIQAFQNGAESLDAWPGDVETAVREGSLTDLPGIGKGISRFVSDLVLTGRTEDLDRLRSQFPPGIPDMLKVPGLGPKKVKALFEGLGIASLDDLERAARHERIRELKGFGSKTEAAILEGMERARQRVARDREG